MNFLQTFDQLSYKKLISIALFLAILFAVPVAVFIVQNETRLTSKAAYVKPKVTTSGKSTPGPIPNDPPVVGRAFPWVGKVGDIIWVQGKNFGINPTDKRLVIGGVEMRDDDIAAWDDTLIQAFIPEGARQGGVVEVIVGNHPVSRSLPFILYDNTAKVKLHKYGTRITASNAGIVTKALIWTGDDEIATQQHDREITEVVNGEPLIFDTQGLPILTIILLDDKGNIVPYYVDPLEFDF